MKTTVRFSREAELDLADLYDHLTDHARPGVAERTLDALEQASLALEEFPHSSHVPAALERIGVDGFLERVCGHYRILYEAVGRTVLIHGVLDGRRDLASLLERRLLRR